MSLLSSLNQQQKEAGSIITGPVLILAGAGSGKTRTITHRIAHMIQEKHIPAHNILAVSFTNKAAKEMQDRVKKLVPSERLKGITLSTFHSLGTKILREEIEALGYHKHFTIYDTSDQMALVSEALRNYHHDKKFEKKVLISRIGFLKNNGITPDDFPSSSHFDPEDPYDVAAEYVYRYYQDKLKFFNAIDFDDILFLTVKLFKTNPLIAEKYSKLFKYIMIDEYQDTNPLQFQLVLGLTCQHNNICVVGDDDQSIYSFRGADISNILNFERIFPNTKIIKLERNYRSTTPILDLANKIIRENRNRKEKSLWSEYFSEEKPYLWKCIDSDHESKSVSEDIKKHIKNGGDPKEVAIIYRSNSQAQIIEEALRLDDINYNLIGGQKFYEKKEVKDLIAYLSVTQNPYDELSLRRILNVPNRGIGQTTLNKFIGKSQETKISLFESLHKHSALAESRQEKIVQFVNLIREFRRYFREHKLPDAISKIVERLRFMEFIEKLYSNPKQVTRRKQDVIYFIESAIRFANNNPQNSTLKNFLERVLLTDSQDKEEEGDESKNDKITMLTLHSSKGLEYDRVYLVGLEEEILPHKKTIIQGDDIEEERRLCYVGVTRARKTLIMTYCTSRIFYGKKIPRHKSRFLNNISQDEIREQNKSDFVDMNQEQIKDYKNQCLDNLIKSLEN